MAERDPTDEHHDEPAGAGPTGERAGGRIRRLGRRLLREVEPDRADRERPDRDRPDRDRPERSILGDAKEVFGAVLEGGDKAKTEVVRAVAREVRTYLDELGLKDDVHHLLTNYSFEIHASVNLRRLAEAEKAPREPKESRASRARREAERRDEPAEGE